MDNNNGSEAVGLKALGRRLARKLRTTRTQPPAPPIPLRRTEEPQAVAKRCRRCGEVYPPTTSTGCRRCSWEGELVPIDDGPRRAA